MFSKSYSGALEVVVVGIAPAEMLLETIEATIKEHGIQNGAVVSGIGTLKVARMHHIEHDHFPPDDRIFIIEKPLEVSSINGIIANGKPHLHMTVGFRDQWSIAGHLEPGSEVLYLAEAVILRFDALKLDRHFDAERRISLLGEGR